MNSIQIVCFALFNLALVFTQDTRDCGKRYGCLRNPDNCQNSDCEYLIKWLPGEDSVDFLMYTNGTANSWLAIGFSTTQIMFNNSVVMCKASPTAPAIETYFNFDHYPAVVDANDRSVGLKDQSVRIRDSSIDCFSRRQISMDSISDQFYNLKNDFYLLVAKGPLNVTTNEPKYHDTTKFISADKINFLKIN